MTRTPRTTSSSPPPRAAPPSPTSPRPSAPTPTRSVSPQQAPGKPRPLPSPHVRAIPTPPRRPPPPSPRPGRSGSPTAPTPRALCAPPPSPTTSRSTAATSAPRSATSRSTPSTAPPSPASPSPRPPRGSRRSGSPTSSCRCAPACAGTTASARSRATRRSGSSRAPRPPTSAASSPRVEIERLLAELPARHRPFVAFAAYVGTRAGETRALTWPDIDLAARTARIDKTYYRDRLQRSTKTGHDRTVPLPSHIATMLAEWRPHCPPSPADLVFPAASGGPLDLDTFRARVFRPAVAARRPAAVDPHPRPAPHERVALPAVGRDASRGHGDPRLAPDADRRSLPPHRR